MEDKTEFLAVNRLGCEFSNKQFSAPSQSENHAKTFDNERPHECSSCFKRFKCYDDLVKHFARHAEKERFRCDICDKDFSESRNLTDHMGLVARKPVFGGLRTTKAQTSLRKRAV